MPPISRRQALSLLPAAGLLAVGKPLPSAAVVGSADQQSNDHTDYIRLLDNTTTIFAGTGESNGRPEVADKLSSIARTARSRLVDLDDAGTGELFAGQPLGTAEANLSRSFQYLSEIALATRTPGLPDTDLVGNVDIQRRVIDGLAWLHENYYGNQDQGYYGNWYHWEIGMSTYISRTLAVLADQITDEASGLATTYVASMDAYLRNGDNGDVDLDSRFHTGANLADITTNRILQGAVLGDKARIIKALDDQRTVFAPIDPYNLRHGVTDGYYDDGSFIQHHSVAYTGSYGRNLLARIVFSIKVLDGTRYASGGELVDVVRRWLVDGFAPVIFEGWMMEIVKGRAVSRTTTGYADVRTVVEAVVDLADYTGTADARALRGYVKFLRSTSRATLDPASFVSPLSIANYADIVADDAVPAADLNPNERSVAFNAMDRTVHRRPGYAFALARSSDRISKYEYMNNENLMPWFQGDGAYYLYLAGQDQTEAYGIDYFTTVSPYRLAGVTSPVEQRQTIPELYGQAWYENPDHPLEFTSSSQSQNTYVYFPRGTDSHSGGATLGSYGAASMVQSDDVAYVDKQRGILPADFVVYQNTRAVKSWFLLDDEIVVLVAGISDPAGRDAVTTLDSRMSEPTDDVVVSGARRDGASWSGSGTAELDWVRYANTSQNAAVGYVLLDRQRVTIERERVTRSRRVVRAANPDMPVTKDVVSVSIRHPGGSAPAALAYALVPHADEATLRSYRGGPLSVLANDERIQAVKHAGLGLVAANVVGDQPRHAERLVIDGAGSVIMRRQQGTVTVAMADPTMNRERVSVIVRGRPLTVENADDGVAVDHVPGGTRLTADTYQAYGQTFTATLRDR